MIDNIFNAVREGKEYIVEDYLDSGGDINIITPRTKSSLLTLAVSYGQENIVDLLIKRGINLDLIDKNHNTALQLAIINEWDKVIEKLVEAGSDLNIENNEGKTPLYNAIVNRKVKRALYFIENGTDLSFRDENHLNYLHLASAYNLLDIVKVLIEKKMYIDSKSKDGRTPLLFAILHGRLAIANLLINKGADISTDKERLIDRLIGRIQRGQDINKWNIILNIVMGLRIAERG